MQEFINHTERNIIQNPRRPLSVVALVEFDGQTEYEQFYIQPINNGSKNSIQDSSSASVSSAYPPLSTLYPKTAHRSRAQAFSADTFIPNPNNSNSHSLHSTIQPLSTKAREPMFSNKRKTLQKSQIYKSVFFLHQ